MMGGRRRILVVEDDPETAGQLVDALTKNGYEIDLAGSGNDALKLARSTEYPVITMDRMFQISMDYRDEKLPEGGRCASLNYQSARQDRRSGTWPTCQRR